MSAHSKRSNIPRQVPSGQRSFTRDELKRLFRAAESIRNQSFILISKDSGLRIEDIRNLNCGMIDLKKEFTIFGLRTRDKNQIAKVCLGPESIDGVKKYLGVIRKRGEIIKENTPLYVKEGKRITTEDLKEIFNTLIKKIRLTDVSFDSFRNFHMNMLKLGGIHQEWIMILQGRLITDPIKSQILPDDNQLIEAYKKAYNNLKILDRT